MACPPTATAKAMSGVYTLNRALSDSSQTLLKMQSVGFLIRQAVQYSNIEQTIKQSTNAAGAEVLHTTAVSTGGVKNEEVWELDGEVREKENWIWGKVAGHVAYVNLADVEDEYLKEGWSDDGLGGVVIETINKSQSDTWTAHQVIGFAEVEGIRRQVRRILCTKGEQVERVRMVYDWKAEL